jgi:ATP-dependent helicase HrpA
MQLQQLWDDSFVWNAPWCVIKEFPRYLQSLAIRIERLKATGSSKDQATESSAKKFWDDYQQSLSRSQPALATIQSIAQLGKNSVGCQSLYPTGKLLEYRWGIEELRVSLHSQQLGTRISISPKRLEKLQSEC